MIRSVEYDAFGPWIYRLGGMHTMPPLFLPWEEETEGALLRIKIPRNIERRDASPDMNLYDRVISLFPDRILILERVERGREERPGRREIPLDGITCLRRTSCLLSGNLSLMTRTESVDIPFNSVSEEIIGEAVKIIRQHMPGGRTEPALPILVDRKNMELPFINMADKMQREDESLLPSANQNCILYDVPRQFSLALLNRLGLKEKVMAGFVILGNGRELVTVQKVYRLALPSPECYSYSTWYIPLSRLEKIEVAPFGDSLAQLRLIGENASPALPYERGNGSIMNLLEGMKQIPVERAAGM